MSDSRRSFESIVTSMVNGVESVIYLLVALFLVIMAFATFFIVAMDLADLTTGTMSIDIIYTSLNDLLVVMIIAELIQTVAVFIRSHRLDLRLIIIAGLTAMIRRVLVFGVEKIPVEEMAVTGLLLVILVAAVYLLSEHRHDGAG
ncbi:MAG TPA: phosphate-starvation-inducible PsiE family protein [Methanocella sp.]|nr:phosphate-starvation-inducible PsiE family protein [Methanocella sp.]